VCSQVAWMAIGLGEYDDNIIIDDRGDNHGTSFVRRPVMYNFHIIVHRALVMDITFESSISVASKAY
jgi:hypothetical protein